MHLGIILFLKVSEVTSDQGKLGDQEFVMDISKVFEDLKEFALFWLPHLVGRMDNFSDLYWKTVKMSGIFPI